MGKGRRPTSLMARNCNIDTAEPLITVEKSFGKYGENPDEDWTETLYKKPTGAYFVYGKGGKNSPYGKTKNKEPIEGDGYDYWLDANYNRARAWVKQNCPDKADKIFSGGRSDKLFTSSFIISEKARENMKRKANEKGISVSELIRDWAENLY